MDQQSPLPTTAPSRVERTSSSPTADEAQTIQISSEGRVSSSSPLEALRARCIGPYVIEQVVSHGGMGIVYKAYDTRLKRSVALKMVLSDGRPDASAVARFRSEAEAIALLQHPNIVQIYEVGEYEGKPYLALEFVDGPNLQQLAVERPLTFRESAHLVRTLCQAIDFAHHRGIVHCDLKPGNILMASENVPKVADFGLARLRDPQHGPNKQGEVLGTPNYMAPEQAEGDPKRIGPAVDIYALGAILYELLTGRPPFDGTPPLETLLRVRLGQPIRPRDVNRNVPRDLEAICLKCLAKDPSDRYETARDLADDLRRFVECRPVAARPPRGPERLWKWIRRNPIVAALLSILAASLVIFQTIVFMQWQKQQRTAEELERRLMDLKRAQTDLDAQRSAARQSRQAADESRLRAEWSLYRSQLAEAEREFSSYSADRARRVLERCAAEFRSWEWHYLRQRIEGTPLTHSLRPGHLSAFAFLPRADEYVLVNADGRIVRFNASTGKEQSATRLPWPDPEQFLHLYVMAKVVPAHDRMIAGVVTQDRESGARRKYLAVWDLSGNQFIRCWPVTEGDPIDGALSPDHRFAALTFGHWQDRDERSTFWGGGIRLYDLATGEILWTHLLDRDAPSFRSVRFLPESHEIVADREKMDLWIFAKETGQVQSQVRLTPGLERLLCVHPIYDWLGFNDASRVRFLDRAGKVVKEFEGHTGGVTCATVTADGQVLVTGSYDQTLRIWDVTGGHCLQVLVGHTAAISNTSISEDKRYVASLDERGRFKAWDLESAGSLKLKLNRNNDWTPSIAFGPGGAWLASASGNGQIIVWNLATRRPEATHQCALSVVSMSCSPNGNLLAVGTRFPNQVTFLDRVTGVIRHRWKPPQKIEKVTFAPDGQNVVVTGENGFAALVDFASGEVVAQCTEHQVHVISADHHPRRRLIATGDQNGMVHLWGVLRFPIRSIKAHDAPVSCVAFSPDGQFLATGLRNREKKNVPAVIRVWNVATGELVSELRGHDQSVWCLAWHPSGRRLASGSEDKSIRIWEPFHGNCLLTLKGPTDDVRCLSFSPDGQLLAASCDDPFIRIWDATPANDSTPSN